MWTLSRPQRQVLATAAILGLMVAPTGYVGWMAWRVNRPVHRHEVERDLSRLIGAELTLESVSYPRPGTVVQRGVVLRDPSSGAKSHLELARAERLQFSWEGRQLTVEAEGLQLRGESPSQALTRWTALLPRAQFAEFEQLSLIAPTCEVDLGSGLPPYALRDVAATLRLDRGVPRLTTSFRLESGRATPRCELTWSRSRAGGSSGGATTELVLSTTDGQSLDAGVLSLFFASGEWLGPAARVQGELVLRQPGSGDWQAEFHGSLLEVDLDALMSHVAPQHRLTGRARIDVTSARWEDQPGRGPGWVEAHGALRGGGGAIGAGFVQALQSQMGFRLGDRVGLARPELEFQALGMSFDLDRTGDLRFRGGLGPDYLPGAVLVQGQRFTPLLSAPDGTATVAALVRTLAPGEADRPDMVIPARFESLMIQRYLPTPPRAASKATRPLNAN